MYNSAPTDELDPMSPTVPLSPPSPSKKPRLQQINSTNSATTLASSEYTKQEKFEEVPADGPPEDTYNQVYITFLLYGMGSLLPWNCITNTFDFFALEMPDNNPIQTYGFANNGLVTIAQIFCTIMGPRLSYSTKLYVGFIGCGAVLVAMPFLANSLKSPANYWSVFCLLLIFGWFSGMVQGTTYTMAAGCGFKYMGMLFFGQGLIALITNVIRGITLFAFPVLDSQTFEEQEHNAFMSACVFYGIAAFFSFVCAIIQFFLARNKLAIYYLDWTKNTKMQSNDLLDYNEKADFNIIEGNNKVVSIAEEPGKETCTSYFKAAYRNFMETNGMLFSLMWVYVLTFICFPSISNATSLKFLFGHNQYFSWANLIFNLTFNVFDTIGRKAAGFRQLDLKASTVKLLSVLRTIFWVTFFLTAFEVGPNWLFWSDWFKIINLGLFSLLNGYLGTLSALKAIESVEGARAGQVGAFIGVTITVGILFGCIVSLAWVPVLSHAPNPWPSD